MREIKFRGYDVKSKKMYYSHEENDDGARVMLFMGQWEIDTCAPGGADRGTIKCDGKHAVLMQFTGLHDKNGVEIFESDIINSEWGNHLVSYEETEAGFMVLNNDLMICGCLSGSIGFNCEVIGNIHENPELLN